MTCFVITLRLCDLCPDYVTYFDHFDLSVHLPNNCGSRGQNAVSGAKTGIRPSLALTKLLEALNPKASQASQLNSTYLSIRSRFHVFAMPLRCPVPFTQSPWFLEAQLKPNSTPGGQAAQFGFAATVFFGKLFDKNQSRMKIADPSLRTLLEVQV